MTPALALGLWFAPAAQAAWYNTTFCVEIKVEDFDDYAYGDYWNGTDGEYQPIRGIWVNIAEYDPSGPFRQMMYEGFASETTGCVTVALNSSYRYEMAAVSEAEVNGVPIEVREGPSATDPLTMWVMYGPSMRYIPALPSTLRLRPDYEAALGELAVGTYAMSLHNAGLGPSTYLRYDSSVGACCNGSNQYAIRASSDSKTKIGHETGHGVGRRRDENEAPEVDYARDFGDCSATPWGDGVQGRWEKDWASAALKEGWADFYAAWLWNDDNQSNCELRTQSSADLDVDGDQTQSPPNAELEVTIDEDHPFVVFSCEGIPVTTGLRSYVSARDWLTDVSVADDSFAAPRDFQCAGDIEGMGTSYDATRYFWDMLTDEDVSFGKLVDIYDRMDPRNWATTRDYVLLSRNPFRRLQAAADAEGVLAEHAAQADNGVNHGP